MTKQTKNALGRKPDGVSEGMWTRYQIYVANTNDEHTKSFDEWLNS